MDRSVFRVPAAAVAAVLVLALAACGSSGNGGGTSSGGSKTGSGKYNAGVPVSGQKKGGTLKLVNVESTEHLDPGQSAFQIDYMILYVVHRSLYYYKPDNTTPIPDLADGPPQVSSDGKTVTVKIKHGIKYGTVKKTPVDGQEVTAQDVKYALERAKNPNVPNGYFDVYFPIVGAAGAKGGPISGIQTPDKYTLVLKLTKNFGATTAKALVMPVTMPVPKSYAQQFDQKNPSTYDGNPTVQAFSGPYMISSYSAGKSLTLVRNPNWDPKTDTRPAYLDRVNWTMGADPNVVGRQVFNGTSIVQGDTPGASIVKLFATQKPQQITFSAHGSRFIGLNTQKKPFDNINVRKAAAAVLDRTAMQRVRGGPVVGDIATHFLTPGIPGFEEAGGINGPGVDFLKNPSGDLALAQSYMKKGGFPSGKANGEQIVMVGDNSSPGKETTLITANSLEKLGFKVKPNLVEHSVMYSKFCGVLEQLKKIDVCSTVGWLPDFGDPYAALAANFNGKSIVPINNTNWSLLNDPKINSAMDQAAVISDEGQRAKAWGSIDKDVTSMAAAIPWFWDKQAGVVASNVQPVIAKWNAVLDLSYVSLKQPS